MKQHPSQNQKRPVVLVADDDEQLVDVLRRRCQHLGLQVTTAHDGQAVLNAIDHCEPDLMILDVGMPNGSGLDLCRTLAASEHTRHMPIIILTGRKDEDTIRRCHDLMAYYVPKCSDVWARIAPLLGELLGISLPVSGPARPAGCSNLPKPAGCGQQPVALSSVPGREGNAGATVLCIDDDCELVQSLKLRLAAQGIAAWQATSGMEGYRSAFLHRPTAIVLDFEMSDGNGDYALRRLKESSYTRDIPVIVLTGLQGKAIERRMANLGATCFFNKPVAWEQLWGVLQLHLRVTPVMGAVAAT
ncbi:MAG TPA: response regulator [Pirellulales bacterium]|jgi:DNA-binding response OmpR family regulator|nr:response regulator [Pirellulales bacterium]